MHRRFKFADEMAQGNRGFRPGHEPSRICLVTDGSEELEPGGGPDKPKDPPEVETDKPKDPPEAGQTHHFFLGNL